MSIFGKKKVEVKTYSFEDMVELSKIKGLVMTCNDTINSYGDASYLTHRLEMIVHVQGRWAEFLKKNPEFEETMKMDFNQLELTKALVTFKIENPNL